MGAPPSSVVRCTHVMRATRSMEHRSGGVQPEATGPTANPPATVSHSSIFATLTQNKLPHNSMLELCERLQVIPNNCMCTVTYRQCSLPVQVWTAANRKTLQMERWQCHQLPLMPQSPTCVIQGTDWWGWLSAPAVQTGSGPTECLSAQVQLSTQPHGGMLVDNKCYLLVGKLDSGMLLLQALYDCQRTSKRHS